MCPAFACLCGHGRQAGMTKNGIFQLFTSPSKIDKIIPLLFGTAYDTKFTLLENL